MNKKILVIGSTNVDFLIKSHKLPSFGETVTGGTFMQNFGGKGANQAVGAARAGGKVGFITCLGEDRYAEELILNFRNDGIDTRFVFREKNAATGSALIMLDKDGNNYLSVASGANYMMSPQHIDLSISSIQEADMLVLQMEIPFETIQYVLLIAAEMGKKVLFNLAPAMTIDPGLLRGINAFVVNEVEASMLTGLPVESDEQVKAAATSILMTGCNMVIITLGSRGSLLAGNNSMEFIPAYKVKAIDTTAAGDVFCGSLAVALAEGKDPASAVKFASAASAISVTRLGAQVSAPTRTEIDDFIKKNSH